MKNDRLFSRKYKWVIVQMCIGYSWLTPLPTKPRNVRGGHLIHGRRYVGSNVYLVRNSRREYRALYDTTAGRNARKLRQPLAWDEAKFVARKYAPPVLIVTLALGSAVVLIWGAG